MPADAEAFDVCGPLPRGTTVLEASAGTGKTFTIAALATRYVAEGEADLSQVLLATFSRAATQELRERVRERLVATQHALADPDSARTGHDPLIRLLADVSDEEVRTRHHRLTLALADFDAATIATTHGFCQQMLAGLGVIGDTDPDAVFTENVDDIVTAVVDDVYLRKYAGVTEPPISYGTARSVARQAMADRHADLVPADAPTGSEAAHRHAVASEVLREVAARKHAQRLIDYDDLLTHLRDALDDPITGARAQHRVRSRYRVVLVDEFQDTDPVQWQILRSAFHGSRTLVLIGDPKQAIYAFRGADLVTYLDAADEASDRRTLARNWRSDEPLVQALTTVFGGAALGDDKITVRSVEAEHSGRRLERAGAPVRLRVVRRSHGDLTNNGRLRADPVRRLVAADVTRDIVRLLGSGRLTLDGEPRPVRPGDVAVLVRTNQEAFTVRETLADANVPAVVTGSRSVFLARVAHEWLTLLRALEQPHRAGLARAAALTTFLGWTAERLATATDDDLDALRSMLRDWRDLLGTRGVAALLEVVTASQGLVARMLATPTGERDLTDLRHIGEALHVAAVDGHLGASALVDWLRRRIDEAEEDVSEERSRRLESDADAVQVVTVHGSKGLQFPIVYLPFAWNGRSLSGAGPLRLHANGRRLLDVGGPTGPGFAARRRAHEAEESGEDLRLCYVAMTRAQCQVVAWWLPGHNTERSPLHRLLFGAGVPGQEPPASVDVPGDDAAWQQLQTATARAGGDVSLERVADEPDIPWTPARPADTALSVAVFDRDVDVSWRRTSYSGLTAALHGDVAPAAGVSSEPEVDERRDEPGVTNEPTTKSSATEPAAVPPADEDVQHLRSVPSPMAQFPSGVGFGTLVHGVIEHVDPASDDLLAELVSRCADEVARRPSATIDPAALAQALFTVVDSPLGTLAGGRRLRDVPATDRLSELEFELPLAGGDEPRAAHGTVIDIATLLRRHLRDDDPIAAYADALDVPGLRAQALRGYLTGSIDAVLRLTDSAPSEQPDALVDSLVPHSPPHRFGASDPRYLVVDYKTNWLGEATVPGATVPDDDSLTAWHYRPSALAGAMVRAHYPLQALLYTVALHRFLRWRQPAYDPARHLGGVLYLFVRGMCGPSTPLADGAPCGVFSWRPPPELVVDVSALLDGGRT